MSQLRATGAFLLLTLATTVQAATITVNTTEMVIDPTDGACTIPEAIDAANTDVPSGGVPGECSAGMLEDTVVLQPGASYVFLQPFGSGGGDVSDTLTISGNGATIKRAPTAGTFDLIHVEGALLTPCYPFIRPGPIAPTGGRFQHGRMGQCWPRSTRSRSSS